MDGDGGFIERIMELGIGMGIARQMPKLMSSCMGEMNGSTPPTPPSIEKADSLYIIADNTQAGPFSAEDVIKLINANILTPSTMVWRQGMSEWTEASKVPEVNRYFILSKI